MRRFFVELSRFIWVQKKFWLVPVVFFLVLLLILVIASVKGGVIAPFIYQLFGGCETCDDNPWHLGILP